MRQYLTAAVFAIALCAGLSLFYAGEQRDVQADYFQRVAGQ